MTSGHEAEPDQPPTAARLDNACVDEQVSATGAAFERFEELVGTLRESCPWDREQTHASLRRHLLEEAHETLEALDARAALDDSRTDTDLDEHLCEELGDLLYQVFFHARVASERGAFDAAGVADSIHDKLVGRHPHVFGGPSEFAVAEDSAAVLGNWEKLKAAEKGRRSSMDDISAAQPALLYAVKTLERAASAGVGHEDLGCGRPDTVVSDAARLLSAYPGSRAADPDCSAGEEPEGLLGDLLLAAVRLAHRRDIDPETALRGAVQRFAAQVRSAETRRLPDSDT